jgi:hypothetical protein
MSLTARDIAFGLTAFLAFPAAINLTALASSDGTPDRPTPIFDRGGAGDEPAGTAGRQQAARR